MDPDLDKTENPSLSLKKTVASPKEDDVHSPGFLFYRSAFLGHPVLKYDDLRVAVPDRFDLGMLDAVFHSWHCSVKTEDLVEVSIDKKNAFLEVHFEHDHHFYRSDTKVTHFISPGKTERKRMLSIKLPNNGFIYPHPNELKIWQSAQPRHPTNGTFVSLDISHLNHFPTMISFAKSYLSVSRVFCKMFFDFENNIFDFKAFDAPGGNDCVLFSFHFLDTIDHEYETDYWLEA